jgi:ATP-dependent DNA helicase PIF1
MELSREQKIIFDKYIQKKNIFITGPGGSGKTALIRKINEHALNADKNIQVCALTGCASILLNCKAKTIHSWAGIGIANGSEDSIIKRIMNSPYKKKTWKQIDILVIDEVSMLSLKLFNLLNKIGKTVRNSNLPFGGIQLLCSGDFYQLPPVGNKDEPDTIRFCFESEDWNKVFEPDCQIPLVKIFRQTDEVYSSILNQIREGKIKRKSNDLLMTYVNRPIDENIIGRPTKLFPTRNKVEYINNSEMENLNGEIKNYDLKFIYDLEMSNEEKQLRLKFSPLDIQTELEYMVGNLRCEKMVKLKVGAQVMCVVNLEFPNGIILCNGSQGIVTKINEVSGLPVVKFNNGSEITMGYHSWPSENIPGIGVSQIPLILAWALTIHKSQGSTLDSAEIDVGSNIFECGQTYVALSRLKSLNGLYLTSYDPKRIKINRKVQEYYDQLNDYIAQHVMEETVPLVIAEAIQEAIPMNDTWRENVFLEYAYEEACVNK